MTFFIGHIPKLFFGSKERLNLALFVDRSTRLDFFAMYYSNAITFLILAICLHFKKYVDNRVTLFILIVVCLDLIHLILFAGKGFGVVKIWLSFTIYTIIRYVSVKKII